MIYYNPDDDMIQRKLVKAFIEEEKVLIDSYLWELFKEQKYHDWWIINKIKLLMMKRDKLAKKHYLNFRENER